MQNYKSPHTWPKEKVAPLAEIFRALSARITETRPDLVDPQLWHAKVLGTPYRQDIADELGRLTGAPWTATIDSLQLRGWRTEIYTGFIYGGYRHGDSVADACPTKERKVKDVRNIPMTGGFFLRNAWDMAKAVLDAEVALGYRDAFDNLSCNKG